LFANGLLAPILIGVVVGTFFNGSDFLVNDMNASTWQHPARGLEAVLNINNVALGLAVFFLARIQALLYFMNSIENDVLFARSKKHLVYNTIPFLVFFLFFVIRLVLKDGYAYNPETMVVSLEPFKYFNNLIQMPLVLVFFLIGVLAVLWGIISSIIKDNTRGIWWTGGGTILVVFSLFLIAGYNNTCYYPSNFDYQSSLNIANSSSSKYTLATMSYVSLAVPFVVAYIWYAWKAINVKKITENEITGGTEGHIY